MVFLLRTVGLWTRQILLSNMPRCPQTSHLVLQVPAEITLAPQVTKKRAVTNLLEELYR